MRLGTRLLLPLVATVSLVMASYGVWSARQRGISLTAESRREAQAYSTALGLALEYAFEDRELRDVEEIIARVGREPAIYGVLVYDLGGTAVFISPPLRAVDAAPPELLRQVMSSRTALAGDRLLGGESVYSVVRPIHAVGDQVAGALEVIQPMAFARSEVAGTRRRITAITIVLLLSLTIVMSLLVRRGITTPLHRVIDAARALGRGELGYRIADAPVTGELKDVVSEFNRMAKQLEASRLALLQETEERILLERRVRSAERMAAVGNLAARLAHEIGTPLQVVAGRADMLLKRDPEPAVRARNLRIMIDQAGRITAIVRNLLDYAQRREPQRTPVSLPAILSGVLEFLDEPLDRAGITLTRSGTTTKSALADADQMHQVFFNLVMNAMQAAQSVAEGGRIEVRVRDEERDGTSWIVVDVADNGPGIPEDVLPHIFEPFFTTKPVPVGAGLGLAVARDIILAHGGRLEAFDRGRQDGTHGARLRVTLPSPGVV